MDEKMSLGEKLMQKLWGKDKVGQDEETNKSQQEKLKEAVPSISKGLKNLPLKGYHKGVAEVGGELLERGVNIITAPCSNLNPDKSKQLEFYEEGIENECSNKLN